MDVSHSNFYADYKNEVVIYLRQTITVLEDKNMKNFAKNCGCSIFG